jgi:hypothetical protein
MGEWSWARLLSLLWLWSHQDGGVNLRQHSALLSEKKSTCEKKTYLKVVTLRSCAYPGTLQGRDSRPDRLLELAICHSILLLL